MNANVQATVVSLLDGNVPRSLAPKPGFPQRNEEVLKMLLQRLEQVSAKLNVAVIRRRDADEIADGSALIARECAEQLTYVDCLLGDWAAGTLSRLEMEDYDVGDIEDVAVQS